MLNTLGRDIPEQIQAILSNGLFSGAFSYRGHQVKTAVPFRTVYPREKKLLGSIREAIELSGLRSGMVISFHHHLRNGDLAIRLVLEEAESMGIKGLTIAASAFFDCHSFIEEYVKKGVVNKIQANYLCGGFADSVSRGLFSEPIIMRTHGGRDRALESGDLVIDVAFIAAPTADTYGNLNAINGPNAFGSFGYAYADARYAKCVVALTDNLMPYPLEYVSIDQTLVDYVVEVDRIGSAEGIVSGTTRITRDPLGRKIAELTANVIQNSGYFKNGFSFQTGAGGISIATAVNVHERMMASGITGSFGLGGITTPMVNMLKEGCFRTLLDTQCFDLGAIDSLRSDCRHREISCSTYSNPHNKGAVVNMLDVAVLGATEIDLDFNVNVTTSSDGIIIGGSGGHADAAAGSKLCVIVSTLHRGRFPTVVESVTTVNTPGETVDVFVTEYGVAVNPRRPEIRELLMSAGLPVIYIEELKHITDKLCGVPEPLHVSDKVIAAVEYRDGTIIDVIRQVSD